MDPTKDILQDKWLELKGQAKQHWDKLTDDDVARLSGKIEEFAGVLHRSMATARLRRKWTSTTGRTTATSRRIVEIETVDKMTDCQIAAKAREHFRV